MNSKELMNLTMERGEIDRIPVCPPFQGFWGLKQSHLTYDRSIDNPKSAAEAQVDSMRSCGFDGGETMWDWLSPAEMLGCDVERFDYGPIATVGHVITHPGVIDVMEIPDPKDDYRFSSSLKTSEHMIKSLGEDTFLYSTICCPFTLAGELRGVDHLLFDTLSEPSFVERMLDFATELLLGYIDECGRTDNDAIMLCDPTASGSLISKDDFLTFSRPYIERCTKSVSESKKRSMLHICGDTNDRLGSIANLDIDVFSMDSLVDIAYAKREVGHKVILLGNVHPETVLFSGRPEDVIRESIDCIQASGGDGFILGTGCDIDVDTPLKNMQTLRKVSDAVSTLFVH